MKKRKVPEGADVIATYKWDFEREEYVLVKREPVKKEECEKGDVLTERCRSDGPE